MELKNRNVVVTGAAMGIGFATTRRLLKEGARVMMWDYNAAALENARAQLKAEGAVFALNCDVTDNNAVYAAAAETNRLMGKVDVLVNNAGFVRGGTFLERPDADWEKTIAVNLTSLVYTTRAFLPAMYNDNFGHVVNIASASATLGVPGIAVYAATKWGVWGLTESLRLEAIHAGKTGVRFSTIHPSYVATGLFEGAKLGFPGNLIVPLLKNHDVVARAVVESALKKGRYSPKRPVTVNLNIRLRGLLPDSWFQRLMVLMGVPQSMNQWKGRN